jgi:hypothetical protein
VTGTVRGRPWAVAPLGVLALIVGLSVTAACSSELAGPTPPSPGVPDGRLSPAPAAAPPTAEGPGLTTPGIRLSAVPRADGSFDITEDVVLRGATSLVQLRPPASGADLPGMTHTEPKALGVQVKADTVPVELSPADVAEPRDLPLVTAATRLQLTYRLTGSTVSSVPSRAGRALAAISPLTAGTDGTLPTYFKVSGTGLLNATCPRLAETRCAVGTPPGLGVRPGIPADLALAVLQLDLPRAP